jgi:hypothetical protein
MKRFLMAVLLSALLPLSVFALCVTQTDTGCSVQFGAVCDNTNCSTTTFVADADGTFDLIAKVDCPDPRACTYCQSLVCLYETSGSTILARLSSNNDACTSCSNGMRVDLRRGHSYTMVVCLSPCGQYRCNDMAVVACHSNCRAVGIVKTPGIPCP